MRGLTAAPLLVAVASSANSHHATPRHNRAPYRAPPGDPGCPCTRNGLGVVAAFALGSRLGSSAHRCTSKPNIHAQPNRRCRSRCALRRADGDRDENDGTVVAAMPLHEVQEEDTLSDASRTNGEASDTYDSACLAGLLEKIDSYCPNADHDLIAKAFYFSKVSHDGQLRKSGEPYFIHPVGVAHIIADMKLDTASVATALLHDTVEDCADVSLEVIETEFGSEIANLVDGATKIGRIQFHSRQERQAENYRKMIVAMARDIRVILVKLADRTHNTRTLEHMSPNKQREVALETLELYAPLAHRLGIHRLKTELENVSLQYLHPESYQQLQVMVAARQEQRQAYTDGVIRILRKHMAEAGLELAAVTGRPKSYFSIYQKMKSQGLGFDDLQDLTAFRILVDDVGECYQALGAVHAMWKPCPGRFKDYIALPKPNGYQSLHTTVIGPEGKRIEVQIRTHSMHETAEGGIAAHWIYKGQNKGIEEARRFTWLRQLVDWVQQLNDPSEFVDSVKEDLFEKEVFVFSPDGQLFALAKGSSVLDFAYRVHSELGNHCVGAKVNGRMVPLKHAVSNGDTVEIIQSANQTPTREWLDIVRSSKAKARIRSFLKQQQRDESIALGRDLLERGLKKQASKRPNINGMKEYKEKLDRVLSIFDLRDEQHLLSAVGYGQVSVSNVVNEILGISTIKQSSRELSRDEKGDAIALQTIREKSQLPPRATKSDGLVVGGERNVLIDFCRNCSPLYGEDVKGVITHGRGIKVHRLGCKYLLESDEERRVDAKWDEASKARPRTVQLEVICEDNPGMLASMSKAISSSGVNIGSVVLKKLSNGRGLARFEVLLSTVEELNKVVSQLQQEQGVLKVERR